MRLLRIGADESVDVISAHSEMGQGNLHLRADAVERRVASGLVEDPRRMQHRWTRAITIRCSGCRSRVEAHTSSGGMGALSQDGERSLAPC